MKVFNSYTGNAILNNALITIEILGGVDAPDEITIEVLQQLFESKNLAKMNRRLKNYTMLFTKNGPLHNDKKNGEVVYNALMKAILNSCENDGKQICELSGLKFETSFSDIYKGVLKNLGYDDKEIKKKDLTIGRTWFPLLGGLGSDAQALPQAKRAINVHPICVFVMQFLPFASVIYKGGVMLIDSSNFAFSKELIKYNIELIQDAIAKESVSKPIQNVKGISKGDFVANAINILDDKEEDYDDDYTDLNFWSFSNSGTGASCAVDRIPNELLRKLIYLYQNPLTMGELNMVLKNKILSDRFIESLDANQDWYGLYPNIFSSGKKAVEYEGVSAYFLEAYFKITKQNVDFEFIKHIAGLILEFKTEHFEKLIAKRDGYKDANFSHELYSVLVKATEARKFNPLHYLEFIDDELPISPLISKYNKLIHFFCYKKEVTDKRLYINEDIKNRSVYKAFEWMVSLINADTRRNDIVKYLLNAQTFEGVRYFDMFLRYLDTETKLALEDIMYVFYNGTSYTNQKGLNKLLRLYFLQTEIEVGNSSILEYDFEIPAFVEKIKEFAEEYRRYYLDKYKNQETGVLPISKYTKQIISLQTNKTNRFLHWMYEAMANLNEYNKKNQFGNQWDEDFLYDAEGNFATAWIRFIIKFQLLNVK